MQTCEKCGRKLESGEDQLCPACRSDRSHKRKKRTGIGVVIVLAALAVWKVIFGTNDS